MTVDLEQDRIATFEGTPEAPTAPDLFDPQHGAAWKWLSGVVIVLLSSCAAVGIGTRWPPASPPRRRTPPELKRKPAA